MSGNNLWRHKREILHSKVHQMLSSRTAIPDIDLDIILELLGHQFLPWLNTDFNEGTERRIQNLRRIADKVRMATFCAIIEELHTTSVAIEASGTPLQRSDLTDEAWSAMGKFVEWARPRIATRRAA